MPVLARERSSTRRGSLPGPLPFTGRGRALFFPCRQPGCNPARDCSDPNHPLSAFRILAHVPKHEQERNPCPSSQQPEEFFTRWA